DDQQLAVGTIAGHFRDRAGHPVLADVVASEPARNLNGFTMTGASGAFSIVVFAGSYQLSFRYGAGVVQYATGQLDPANATLFAVKDGKPETVEEKTVPTGSATGRMNRSSGTPAANANVELDSVNHDEHLVTQVGANGTYRLDLVPAGTYTMQ